MDIVFHYPPDLFNLLVDAIPRLCRSKKDVLLFFRGAGVPEATLHDLSVAVRSEPEGITKFTIVRTVLTRLNERGEQTLRERREVLKRVVEFEDFSTCWPNDQLIVKGLVAEIRRVVNVKDSFTRMHQERESDREQHKAMQRQKLDQLEKARVLRESIKQDLYALFKDSDAHRRGKALEGVMNRLFKAEGLLVRDAFTLSDPSGKGIFEQIDGVIQFDGSLYLVELKWWSDPIGPGDVAQHMVRVHSRGHSRGIFISTSRFTPAAIQTCREALARSPFVLSELQEFVLLLERNGSLTEMLQHKIAAAIVDKEPLALWEGMSN
jgi:restriction system protein